MIVFENAGEIDVESVRTFGVSVKFGDNPIGKFGTGLKYALATLMRTSHRVYLLSGFDEMRFSSRRINVRGKDFELVEMSVNGGEPQSLGFTTELGQTWETWMAYRELYCNAKDEGGSVYEAVNASAVNDPRRDLTQIRVIGRAIEDVHAKRGEYFLEGEPDAQVGDVAIYRRPSRALFHRGIRVLTLPKPATFTYDLRGHVELTEDRTMAHPFLAQWYVARAFAGCPDRELVRDALTAIDTGFEAQLDFADETIERPGDAFMAVVEDLVGEQKRQSAQLVSPESNGQPATIVAPSAVKAWQRHHRESPAVMEPLEIDDAQRRSLVAACRKLRALGIPLHAKEVWVVERVISNRVPLLENHYLVSREALKAPRDLLSELVLAYVDQTKLDGSTEDFLIERLVDVAMETVA